MQTTTAERPQASSTFYKKIRDGVAGFFNAEEKKTSVAEPVNETEQDKAIGKVRAEMQESLEEFKNQTSLHVEADKLSNAINKFQAYEAFRMQSSGVEDGIAGVRNRQISADVETRATFIVEHTESILAGNQESLKQQKAHREQNVSYIQQNLEVEKSFSKRLSDLQKNEYRHFHRIMALFYIMMGICMMIADFPISLGIAGFFIDLPVGFDGTFWSKLTNPEILLFSLGITFLSIYFKIFYDEYINRSIIKPEGKEAFKDGINPQAIIAFVFKLVVLICLLFLLWKMGCMRNAMNTVPIELTKATKDLGVEDKQVFNYKLISFVFTTILLPLISGICLSLGLGIFANRSNLKLTISEIDRLTAQLKNEKDEITKLDTLASTIAALYKDWSTNKEKRLAGLSKQFESYYVQGFRKGHRARFGYDIYENANALFIDSLTSNISKQ